MTVKRRGLAARRRAVGFSQERLAEWLGVERSTVVRWESGETENGPQPWIRPKLAQALQISLDDLASLLTRETADPPAVTAGSAESPASSPIACRTGPRCPGVSQLAVGNPAIGANQDDLDSFHISDLSARILTTAGSGRRIGRTTVRDLASRVHRLRLADDLLAGGDLIVPACRELKATLALYHEASFTERVGTDLLVQLAELAQIAGWIASDTGRHELAARAYRLGISAAQEAADTTLVGNLMSSLAYQQTNTGRVTEGIQLADAALAEAGPDIPAKARALFLDRLAWAQTRAGEDGAAIRTLGDARDALLNDTGGEAPLWAYWVNHDELDVMDARVYTELRRPLKAVTLLSKVLDRYDPTHARELALYLSWLAVAYSDANEPEAAADAARRMLELSADLPSDRTAERTQITLRRLAEFGKTEKVGTLLAEYRTPTSFSTSMEVWPNTGGSRRHSSEPPP